MQCLSFFRLLLSSTRPCIQQQNQNVSVNMQCESLEEQHHVGARVVSWRCTFTNTYWTVDGVLYGTIWYWNLLHPQWVAISTYGAVLPVWTSSSLLEQPHWFFLLISFFVQWRASFCASSTISQAFTAASANHCALSLYLPPPPSPPPHPA